MTTDMRDVLSDLVDEGADIDQLVADATPKEWALPTAAPGWTVAHQVAHLAATFRLAGVAVANPTMFEAIVARLTPDFDANVSMAMAEYVAEQPDVLLGRWRTERDNAVAALAAVPMDQMVPWLVNPLPAGVLACAGMMELFGHGQDIADALGKRREITDRIGHLVGFAVRTRDFGYLARKQTPPTTEFRFETTAPSGALWTFGPIDATERISGPAVDLCLLVTRRRHRADLALTAIGAEADHWLDIAQAYRGPAGTGRQPGQFAAAVR